MFHKVPIEVSSRGLTYEISDPEWTVVSITKTGKRKVMKPSYSGRVKLAGKTYTIYDVAKLAGLDSKSWPSDDRRWYEHEFISDVIGYRYRQFYDGQVQRMDQHGNVKYQKWMKDNDGYYSIAINGEKVLVHQLMGMTPFVPKPRNMPSDWTIHHVDNVPANNHAWNLEWASKKKQTKERRSMEQSSIRSCPMIGTALRDVTLDDGTIIRKGEDTQTFDNALEAMNVVGGDRSHISKCINIKQKSHANFTWRTPPSDLDFDKEVFKSVEKNTRHERFISTFGRMKYAFKNGYIKIRYAKDLRTKRQQQETDSYPDISINKNLMKFHRKVVELFFGKIPKTIVIDGKKHNLVIDHIDDDKQNARLGNLQLLTNQENVKKRYLKVYKTSVASFYEKKYEYHKTRIDAIEYVKQHGHPEATLEELNAHIHLIAHMNIPAKLYDRMWIRAHFECVV